MRTLPNAARAAALAASLFLPPLGTVWAQDAAPAVASEAAADVEALLRVLENDTARAQLIERMRAEAGSAGASPAAPARGPFLAPVSEAVGALGDQVSEFAAAVSGPGGWEAWLAGWADGAGLRLGELAATLALALGVSLSAGGAAAWLAGRPLAGALRDLRARAIPSWPARAAAAAAGLILRAMPVAAFAAGAYAALFFWPAADEARVVSVAAVASIALAWLGIAAARAILVPLGPGVRPSPLRDETAAYLFVWSRRLILFTAAAYFLAQAVSLLGAPANAGLLLVKALGLVFALLLTVLVLQSRKQVGAWIAGANGGDPAKPNAVRQRIGDIWHVPALTYIAGAWLVWTLEVADGFAFLTEKTGATVLVLAVAWLAAAVIRRGLDALFGVTEELGARHPIVVERANLYVPTLRSAIALVVGAAAVLAVLQAWGLGVLGWLADDLGREVARRMANIAVILAVAVAAWEVGGIAVRLYLERTDDSGADVVQSRRIRTLLPLARNALAIVIGTLAALMVLSEVGVSVGPLIAGAGVAGLAVGFGAQTLVKDVITGVFILMEDSVHVGDVVRAGGKAGLVEALTVRTIRLRDLSGTVHVVPFSTVDAIENLTKDFSYAVLDIGVAYREDYDRVVEVLRDVGEKLREDSDHGPTILAPLEVLGLERLDDSAVVVRVRLKTRPLKQWGVRREFLRLVKRRFEAEGIEIPFPHRTIYFGADQERDPSSLLDARSAPGG